MTTPIDVQTVVRSAGGNIPGKTRLQKSAYFLEAAGVGFGFDFSYHFYGPYSEELAIAASDAAALNLISADWETSSGGFRYAAYRAAGAIENDATGNRRRQIMFVLGEYDAVTLELAATAHFLAANGYDSDPWKETRRRKAGKITEQRLERARQLLDRLGLPQQ